MPTATLRHTIGIEQVTASLIPLLTPTELGRTEHTVLHAIVARRTADGRPTSVVGVASDPARLARAAVEVARTYAATRLSTVATPPPSDSRTTAVCHCGGTVHRQVAEHAGRFVPYWVHDHDVVGAHAARPGLAVTA